MTPEEVDAFLRAERTCRVATVRGDGAPHVVPLWFVWHEGSIWINNLRRARRSRDLEAGSAVALCIDTGVEYFELRGAVVYGTPQTVDPEDPALAPVRQGFGDKYFGGNQVPDVKSHQWLRVVPDRIASWDFRKIPAGRDGRAEMSKQPQIPRS
jgi:nitroimidazol reductase NimA-like FMN-containing flavoprotein (pyridoxamine 5'-phosphate oxidase superfamily)